MQFGRVALGSPTPLGEDLQRQAGEIAQQVEVLAVAYQEIAPVGHSPRFLCLLTLYRAGEVDVRLPSNTSRKGITEEKAMNSTAPNLFHYATKELAQDATLAYILAWAKPAYREAHPRLYRLGTDMLQALLATKIGETAIPTVTSLDVKTQVDRIDLLALINVENEDGLVLLVEDKVDTDEHSNQLKRYIETAKKRYPKRQIVPVYVKTGNASQWSPSVEMRPVPAARPS